jgi:predicted dehydrogenase
VFIYDKSGEVGSAGDFLEMAAISAAVVGLGRAGAARVRTLQEPGSPATLSVVVSRRPPTPAHGGITYTSSLCDIATSSVNAVFICTENEDHFAAAAAALWHRKHVCVEYPLCLSLRGADFLARLASRRGVVLHCEHIELLADSHVLMKRALQARLASGGAAVSCVRVSFAGAPLPPSWGHPAFSGISRLTRAWDLLQLLPPAPDVGSSGSGGGEALGRLRVVSARFRELPAVAAAAPVSSSGGGDGEGGVTFALDVTLEVGQGGGTAAPAGGSNSSSASAPRPRVEWTEVRAAGGGRRALSVDVEFTDGSVLRGADVDAAAPAPAAAAAAPKKGLFAQDLDLFCEAVRRRREEEQPAAAPAAAAAAAAAAAGTEGVGVAAAAACGEEVGEQLPPLLARELQWLAVAEAIAATADAEAAAAAASASASGGGESGWVSPWPRGVDGGASSAGGSSLAARLGAFPGLLPDIERHWVAMSAADGSRGVTS